ncbi:retrotransposon protein, putative, ty1-copia subclass [Tanacetum coccineum]
MGSITSLKCVLTQEHLDAICAKYFVPEEVHPQLPSSDATMHERPTGKIGMYTRFFDYANYRIPFSTFFVSVLTHFRIPFSQLSVFGSAKVWGCEALVKRGRAMDLKEIQDEDTSPSEITSEITIEVEGFAPPQEEEILIRRSERTHRAQNRLSLNVEADEHSIRDLNEPTSYKAAMLDSKSNKWIDAINTEIQSMMDNMQASRSWNKRFDEEIKRFGFDQNLDEPCVYQKASGSNVTFLILYVDDIIIIGNHISSLQNVKDYLGKCFAMKDLGEATFILGIKTYRDRSKRLIGLGQNSYMDNNLKRYKMDYSKRGHIPMQERLDLNKIQGASTPKEVKRMQNVPYASDVGSIMYAVRCTRPDVAFAQNITSRFQQNPGELHWTAVKNILTYLRNTKDMFLVYGGNPEAELRVDCYCDTRFETDKDDTKSQT